MSSSLSSSLSAPSGATLIGNTVSGTLTAGTSIWTNPIYTATATPANTTIGVSGWYTSGNIPTPSIKVVGDAEFEGEVKIKGVKLDERLNAIEDRLAILRPNYDLEGKWEELKELGERYRQLEKEILEKEAMWKILGK